MPVVTRILLRALIAVMLFTSSVPVAADPGAAELLHQLDSLNLQARTDVTAFDRWQALWDSLSADMQQEIRALEQARAAAANPWLADQGQGSGLRWAADTGTLLTSIAELPGNADAPGMAEAAHLQSLQAELAAVEFSLDGAETAYQDFTTALRDFRNFQPVNIEAPTDQPLKEYLSDGQVQSFVQMQELTVRYGLLTDQIEQAQASVDEALTNASAEQRFHATFNQAQAISQQTAEMLAGQLAFSNARSELSQRIEVASSDGRASAAEQWQTDLVTLAEIENSWVGVQQSLIASMVAQQNRNFAANAAAGLGPQSSAELVQGIVDRGLQPVTDAAAIAAIENEISSFVLGAQRTQVPSFTLQDGLLQYSASFDEAVVSPVELMTEPVDSISGNLRFWRRYAAYGYGIGSAAVMGVLDLIDLTIEAIDLNLELHQSLFNLVFHTNVDWFGNENIQFISGAVAGLSAAQAEALGDAILTQLDRRIAQNAARGEAGLLDSLTDFGIAVGTVAGAEEGLIRVAVIATKHGRVLIKGQKVNEFIASAGLDNLASTGLRSDMPGARSDPFSASDVNPGAASSDIPTPSEVNHAFRNAETLRDALPGELPDVNRTLINAPGGQRGTLSEININGVDYLQITVGNKTWTLPQGTPMQGSFSRVWINPDNSAEVLKITHGTAKGGLWADNYANKLLLNLRDSGALDTSKVHVLDIKAQVHLGEGQVLTVMERADKTVLDLIDDQGFLYPHQVEAIIDGLQELARHKIVLPDGKLDNLALTQRADGSLALVPLDVGGGMAMKTPTDASGFMNALYNPPPELVAHIENLPVQHYLAELSRVPHFTNAAGFAQRATPQEIAEAANLLSQSVPHQMGYFQRVQWGNSNAALLADSTFRWTRIRAHKQWLADTYDTAGEFAHLRAGTGLDIHTFGPGGRGMSYNPAGGRESPALRIALGGNPDAPVKNLFTSPAGSPPLAAPSVGRSQPFRIEIESSIGAGSAAPSLSYFELDDLPLASAVPDTIVYLPPQLADDFFKSMDPLQYAARRIPFFSHRLYNLLPQEPVAIDPAMLNLSTLLSVPAMQQDANALRIQQSSSAERTNLPPDQWPLQHIGLFNRQLMDSPKPSVVAVIDTGVAWAHPSLNAHNMWINTAEIPGNKLDDDNNGYVDDIVGWNFVENNNLPWDTDGHGTMVAGIIAAQPNPDMQGVNPHARIMALRVLDEQGQGRAFDVAEAILYAATQGADVINLSLGGMQLTQAESMAIHAARQLGSMVVVAAGNEGIELTDYGPAMAPGALVVGAVDRQNQPLNESNWGDSVAMAAPGKNIVSLRAPGTHMMKKYLDDAADTHLVGQHYYQATGTSFAAPLVSGVASLLRSRDASLAPADLYRLLQQNSRDIAEPGTDLRTGYGLLDASATLAADPQYYIDASISGVQAVQLKKKPALAVRGTASADEYHSARISLASPSQPQQWRDVANISKAMINDTLAVIPAQQLRGENTWTLRLLVQHKNGRQRESRFQLNLQ